MECHWMINKVSIFKQTQDQYYRFFLFPQASIWLFKINKEPKTLWDLPNFPWPAMLARFWVYGKKSFLPVDSSLDVYQPLSAPLRKEYVWRGHSRHRSASVGTDQEGLHAFGHWPCTRDCKYQERKGRTCPGEGSLHGRLTALEMEGSMLWIIPKLRDPVLNTET